MTQQGNVPGGSMQLKNLYKPMRVASFVVLALMVVSALYAFTMTVLHWTGINV